MSSIIVEDVAVRRGGAHGEGTKEGLYELEPGKALTFGRGAPDVAVDIVVPHQGVSRFAGEIRAVDDYWLLTNSSHAMTYVVENLEGAGEHVKVTPRRLDAPIPFELGRLILPSEDGSYEVNVYAPQHAYLDRHGPSSGDATTRPYSLDESSKYFQVLVALCEPRLRDPATVEIPSSEQVAERLGGTGTRSAVDYHIDYLAETKLRIKPPSDGSGARLERKRESLVALALRFDLVREEHLELLADAH